MTFDDFKSELRWESVHKKLKDAVERKEITWAEYANLYRRLRTQIEENVKNYQEALGGDPQQDLVEIAKKEFGV